MDAKGEVVRMNVPCAVGYVDTGMEKTEGKTMFP